MTGSEEQTKNNYTKLKYLKHLILFTRNKLNVISGPNIKALTLDNGFHTFYLLQIFNWIISIFAHIYWNGWCSGIQSAVMLLKNDHDHL